MSRCTNPNTITWEFQVQNFSFSPTCLSLFFFLGRRIVNLVLFRPHCVILTALHLSTEKCNFTFFLLPSSTNVHRCAHTHTQNYFIKAYNCLRWHFWQKCTLAISLISSDLIVATAEACKGSDSSEVWSADWKYAFKRYKLPKEVSVAVLKAIDTVLCLLSQLVKQQDFQFIGLFFIKLSSK